jgi:hypothetical protein
MKLSQKLEAAYNNYQPYRDELEKCLASPEPSLTPAEIQQALLDETAYLRGLMNQFDSQSSLISASDVDALFIDLDDGNNHFWAYSMQLRSDLGLTADELHGEYGPAVFNTIGSFMSIPPLTIHWFGDFEAWFYEDASRSGQTSPSVAISHIENLLYQHYEPVDEVPTDYKYRVANELERTFVELTDIYSLAKRFEAQMNASSYGTSDDLDNVKDHFSKHWLTNLKEDTWEGIEDVLRDCSQDPVVE